jgi:hypothetical protein
MVLGGNRGTDMHDLIRRLGLGRGRPRRPHIDVDIVCVYVPSKSREMQSSQLQTVVNETWE